MASEGGFVELRSGDGPLSIDATIDPAKVEQILEDLYAGPTDAEPDPEIADEPSTVPAQTEPDLSASDDAATEEIGSEETVDEASSLTWCDAAEGGMVELVPATEAADGPQLGGAAPTVLLAISPSDDAGSSESEQRALAGPIQVDAGLGLFRAFEIAGAPVETAVVKDHSGTHHVVPVDAEPDTDGRMSQARLPIWLNNRDAHRVTYLYNALWAIPILTIAAEVARRRRRLDRRTELRHGQIRPRMCDYLFGHLPLLQLDSAIRGGAVRLTLTVSKAREGQGA
jgi:hypothetical protein